METLVRTTVTHQKTRPPRILLVDDDPMTHETVEAQLYQEGYELFFGHDGAEALQQVATNTPDVILLDVMMPGMDGFEVCQLLKSSPQSRHIPIILFTALDDVKALVTGLNAGADEFVTKPVTRAELCARVRSMLRIKEQYRELQEAQQLRERLSRMITHDMNNPLAGITLHLHLLQRQNHLNEKQRRHLALIEGETKQLNSALGELQLVNKLGQNRLMLNRQLVHLASVLDELQEQHTAMAAAREVTLQLSCLPTPAGSCMLDPQLLQRLLNTLVRGAISSAPTQSIVAVQLSTQSTSIGANDALLTITVTDEGPSTPPTWPDSIYDLLESWDLLAPDRPHIGVGLAVCQLIAEAHGGTIGVTNRATGGAIFQVNLPTTLV